MPGQIGWCRKAACYEKLSTSRGTEKLDGRWTVFRSGMGRLSPTLELKSAYGGYYNNRWLKQAQGRTEKVPQRDRSNYLVIAVESSIRKRGEFRVTLGAIRSPHASNLQFNRAAYCTSTADILQKYCKRPALALQRSCKPTAQILQFILALTQPAFF
jgi:hypothetical protein